MAASNLHLSSISPRPRRTVAFSHRILSNGCARASQQSALCRLESRISYKQFVSLNALPSSEHFRSRRTSGLAVRSTCSRVEASLADTPAQPAGGGPGEGCASPALPSGPGVYAVYSADMALQYVGMSRHISSSVEAHLRALPGDMVAFVKVRGSAAPGGEGPGLTSRELQAAWKEWIVEHGAVPPGNQKGETKWSVGTARAGGRRRAAATSPRRPAGGPGGGRVQACRSPRADEVVTEEVVHRLLRDGYAVVDGAIAADQADAAVRDAEGLAGEGLLRAVSSQQALGRLDEICVFDISPPSTSSTSSSAPADHTMMISSADSSTGRPQTLARDGAGVQALGAAAALMKGLPHAIQDRATFCHRKKHEGLSSGGTALPDLEVPAHLMLAVYPGGGSLYLPHLDNDPGAEGVWEGPPGQRIGDREITAILYLNTSWDADSDGGCLRLFGVGPGGRGSAGAAQDAASADAGDRAPNFIDVAPQGGRLVMFLSREVEHEVRPTWKRRWAMSAWLPNASSFQSTSK